MDPKPSSVQSICSETWGTGTASGVQLEEALGHPPRLTPPHPVSLPRVLVSSSLQCGMAQPEQNTKLDAITRHHRLGGNNSSAQAGLQNGATTQEQSTQTESLWRQDFSGVQWIWSGARRVELGS